MTPEINNYKNQLSSSDDDCIHEKPMSENSEKSINYGSNDLPKKIDDYEPSEPIEPGDIIQSADGTVWQCTEFQTFLPDPSLW